ncbi:MAG: dnaJ subfamily C er 7-like isoform X1 [Anaerolineales bacterium]|nr:dnaJ subfamily C er 7-like isoform X1 [Anaerolineales bacterium]
MKYYEILDVPPDATPEQIKAAYRILVQLHHPDRLQQSNPGVRQYAEERLKRINEAYTVLSDPAKRAKYDALYAPRKRWAEALGRAFRGRCARRAVADPDPQAPRPPTDG